MDEKLTDLYNTLHDAQLQLQGEDYSRRVLTVSVPTEGDEAYTAMDDIRNICAKYYNKSDVILVGDCTSNHDLMSSFATDNIIISVLTALFVMIILLFTFQSAGHPDFAGIDHSGKYLDQFLCAYADRRKCIFHCVPDCIRNPDGCDYLMMRLLYPVVIWY